MKIEVRLKAIEKRVDLMPRIMEMLDSLTKDVKDIKQEHVLMVNWLKNHGYRIEKIESKIGINHPPKLLRQV